MNPDNLFSVRDRVVVVTGALGQLGRSFTRALASRGAFVAALDRVEPSPDWLRRRDADGFADRVEHFLADATDRASLVRALEAIRAKWETPFGLVNNAALDSPPGAPAEENGPFETYPEESWDRVMEVNAKGTFLACQAFGGAMAEAGRGSIVNVASIYGMVSPNQTIYEYRREGGAPPFYKPVAYAASKSALYNLTRYLATYWAPRVRVNVVTFAGVFNGQDERFLNAYLPHMPMGRMAREDEYDGTILYLLSDASAYMTGANVVVDGGWTAW